MSHPFDFETGRVHELATEHVVQGEEAIFGLVERWGSIGQLQAERQICEDGRVVEYYAHLARPESDKLGDFHALQSVKENGSVSAALLYGVKPSSQPDAQKPETIAKAIAGKAQTERQKLTDVDVSDVANYEKEVESIDGLAVVRVRKAHEQPLEGEDVAYDIAITTKGQAVVMVRLDNEEWQEVSLPNSRTTLAVKGRVIGEPVKGSEDVSLKGAGTVYIQHDGQETLSVRVVASSNLEKALEAAKGLFQTTNGLGALPAPHVLANYAFLNNQNLEGVPEIMDFQVGPAITEGENKE